MATIFKKQPTTAPMQFSLRVEPEFSKQDDKVRELQGSLRKFDTEESAVLQRLHAAVARSPADDMNSRVASLLDEEIAEDDPHTQSMRSRLAEINSIRQDTRTALEIAKERRQKARYAASKTIVESVRPEYVRRVQALAAALIAAHEANVAVEEITNALEASDAAWTGLLRPAQANMLNKVDVWLKDAAAHDLIDLGIIPPGLKL